MELEKSVITANNYFLLLKIYNSKKLEFERFEICNFMGISVNNSNTYNKIINLFESFKILVDDKFPDTINSIKIRIDRKKLEKLILSLDYYKWCDEFIHKCMFGALTP